MHGCACKEQVVCPTAPQMVHQHLSVSSGGRIQNVSRGSEADLSEDALPFSLREGLSQKWRLWMKGGRGLVIFFPTKFYLFTFSLCILPTCMSMWEHQILELQTVVGYPVGAEIWTRVLWKRSQCPQPLSPLFSSKARSFKQGYYEEEIFIPCPCPSDQIFCMILIIFWFLTWAVKWVLQTQE